MTIQWNPRYATGIIAIDDQHKNLFEQIHRLHQAIEAGHAKEETTELMAFLLRYVDEHFSLEEAYMERIGYPDLAQHQEYHQRLRKRVQQMADRFAQQDPNAGIELSLLLFEWLKGHILHDDFAYVEHARKRRLRPA